MRTEKQALVVVILCLLCFAGSGRTSKHDVGRVSRVPFFPSTFLHIICRPCTLRGGGNGDPNLPNQVTLPLQPPSIWWSSHLYLRLCIALLLRRLEIKVTGKRMITRSVLHSHNPTQKTFGKGVRPNLALHSAAHVSAVFISTRSPAHI